MMKFKKCDLQPLLRTHLRLSVGRFLPVGLRVSLLIPLIFIGMISCSHDRDSENNIGADTDLQKENLKLEAFYQNIVGVYEGQITERPLAGSEAGAAEAGAAETGSGEPVADTLAEAPAPEAVSLTISLQRVPKGYDVNGRMKYTVSPLARLRYSEVIRPDILMTMEYKQESGRFFMTDVGRPIEGGGTPGSGSSENQIAMVAIDGFILNGRVDQASVTFDGRPGGKLDLTQVSKELPTSFAGDYQDSRDRLKSFLSAAEGSYEGTLIEEVNGKKVSSTFTLNLFVEEFSSGRNDQGELIMWSRLVAFYQRKDFRGLPLAEAYYRLSARRIKSAKGDQLILGGDDLKLILDMEIEKNIGGLPAESGVSESNGVLLEGELSDVSGFIGNVKADRVGPAMGLSSGLEDESYTQRLSVWRQFVGKFGGTILFTSGKYSGKKFPAYLKVYIMNIYKNGAVEPRLAATFEAVLKGGEKRFNLLGEYLPRDGKVSFATDPLLDTRPVRFQLEYPINTKEPEVKARINSAYGNADFDGLLSQKGK